MDARREDRAAIFNDKERAMLEGAAGGAPGQAGGVPQTREQALLAQRAQAGGGGAPGSPPAAPQKFATPNADHVRMLQKSPQMKADFERKFGPGSADAALKAPATQSTYQPMFYEWLNGPKK